MAKKINIPTQITLARIVILPLILFFYISPVIIDGVSFFADWGKLIALVLFILAAATDWLDGFIARKYNMVTTMGKFLDPIADKMLTTLGFILVISDPMLYNEVAFPYWFAVVTVFIALGRDIIMNSLRSIAAEQGIVIAADNLGKVKSTLQYVGIALLMFFAINLWHLWMFDNIWYDIFAYACVFIMSAATILSIWSCVNYVVNYTKSIKTKENKTDGSNDETGKD